VTSSDLAVIPQDPSALDHVQDAAAAMVALVDQARTMLAQAKGMEGIADVIEWRSRAEAIRVYTQQKDMGHEAELSAAEIVRRAERRIGQLIREGQAAGEIATEREGRVLGGKRRHGQLGMPDTEHKPTATSILGEGPIRTQVAAMTDDVSDEDFEEAIEEAKQEGNMSRANVVRKVKPTTAQRIADAAKNNPADPPRNLPLAERSEQIRTLARRNFTSPQIADEIGVSPHRVREIARSIGVEIPADAVFGGKFRKVDPNRVIDTIIHDATPESASLAFVAYSELDRDRLDEWVSSLSDAIRSLTTIKRNLQKELTRDQ
jgi:hypothetical protein